MFCVALSYRPSSGWISYFYPDLVDFNPPKRMPPYIYLLRLMGLVCDKRFVRGLTYLHVIMRGCDLREEARTGRSSNYLSTLDCVDRRVGWPVMVILQKY